MSTVIGQKMAVLFLPRSAATVPAAIFALKRVIFQETLSFNGRRAN